MYLPTGARVTQDTVGPDAMYSTTGAGAAYTACAAGASARNSSTDAGGRIQPAQARCTHLQVLVLRTQLSQAMYPTTGAGAASLEGAGAMYSVQRKTLQEPEQCLQRQVPERHTLRARQAQAQWTQALMRVLRDVFNGGC